MRAPAQTKPAGFGLFLATIFILAACAGNHGGQAGSLYTPVREGQAIGPLPEEPVPYYPYQPRLITTWEELPPAIRVKAEAHVRQRVGEAFYRRLRFAGGQIVDRAELRRVNPASRQFRKEVPAYLLKFAVELRSVGIREYTASISLGPDGGILSEIDLPSRSASGDELSLKPLPEISRELARQGLIDPATATATVTFDRQRDDFLWHFEQVLPGGGPEVQVRTVEVDARTGEIVRR